jgi:Lrp/AsnC family leucine-responsive transcriptional regulator
MLKSQLETNKAVLFMQFDDIDQSLIELLQENARRTVAEISRHLNVPASTVAERIRRLEERGVIRGYHASVDPLAFGLHVTAFVFVEATELAREHVLEQALLAMPAVQEIHKIAGEDAFLVKIRAKDNTDLAELLRAGIEHAGVRSIRTTIVLATARERSTLELPETRESEPTT